MKKILLLPFKIYNERGFTKLVQVGTRFLLTPFTLTYSYLAKRKNLIQINSKKYKYFYHWYNTTWRNERTIEIPFALELLKNSSNKKILEVGNVLKNYISSNHIVVDKYCKSEGVINEDVVDLDLSDKYDLILSISTIEHVGWDEDIKDKKKIPKAINHLLKQLKEKGKLFLTFPIGYNPFLDTLLKENEISFDEAIYLKRKSLANEWKEVTLEEVLKSRYNFPYPCANGLIIGYINKGT